MITMKMLVKKFYDELREANLAHYADSYEKSKWNVIIYIKSGGNDVLFNEWCKENCNDAYERPDLGSIFCCSFVYFLIPNNRFLLTPSHLV